jgi:type IV secretory pathway VirB10-like protein
MKMTATVRSALLIVGLAACTGSEAEDASAAAASGVPHTGTTLQRDTRIHATLQDSVSSARNKPGDVLHAIVSRSVIDSGGGVVIPSGSTITLAIATLESGLGQRLPAGRLALVVRSVSVNGRAQTLTGELEPVAYHMEGRAASSNTNATAAAGAVISDLVVSAGTPVVIKLSNTLNVTAR